MRTDGEGRFASPAQAPLNPAAAVSDPSIVAHRGDPGWPFGDSADHGDVPATYDAEPWPGVAGLSERHLALYRALWRCTAPGSAVAHVRHKVLAQMVGLRSDRQVRRLMADLYPPRGWVIETRTKVSCPNGGERWGASYYTLKVPLVALPPPPFREHPNGQAAPLGHDATAGRTARTTPEVASAQVAPLGHQPPCPNKNLGTAVKQSANGEVLSPPTVTVVAPEPIEIAVEPPTVMLLDHDPSAAEVLATLERAFGPVVVERWPAGMQPAPTYSRGRRPRRGRPQDSMPLDGELGDLRTALVWLENDTCAPNGDRCGGRHRCRRHTPRRRPA